ncbi:hypothetical protein ASD00_33915 [Ensifer sp. Root31]|nr:hypothetical protein ASD00_33915 [Ensifer sp. Root31]
MLAEGSLLITSNSYVPLADNTDLVMGLSELCWKASLEIAAFNDQVHAMCMETFVRISRLRDQARSLTRSWKL